MPWEIIVPFVLWRQNYWLTQRNNKKINLIKKIIVPCVLWRQNYWLRQRNKKKLNWTKNFIWNALLSPHLRANKNPLYLEIPMDKPVLIIEAPELNDEAVASFYYFLQDFVLAFE